MAPPLRGVGGGGPTVQRTRAQDFVPKSQPTSRFASRAHEFPAHYARSEPGRHPRTATLRHPYGVVDGRVGGVTHLGGEAYDPPKWVGGQICWEAKLNITTEALTAIVTAAVVEAVKALDTPAEPKAPKKATKKVSKADTRTRAERKAANQTLMRSINGKLAAATKATDEAKARAFLRQATAMTPATWAAVHAQIVRKHEALGLAA